MHAPLTIGDFSRITHLSVKALRRYHEAGLLEPGANSVRHLVAVQAPQPGGSPIVVEHRTVTPRLVAAIGETVDHDTVLDWFSTAMTELDDVLRAHALTANVPSGGLYDNTLFTDERGDAVVYISVTAPPRYERVRPYELPAGELAITVHHGRHDDIDVTYGLLGSYVAANALVVAGPVHEMYVVGPRDTDGSDAWRTEIGCPVFHTNS